MARVQLKDLSKEEFKKFIDSFDIILSDIDGTIYHHATGVYPGIPDFFEYAKQLGKKTYFVTNNNQLTLEEHYTKIKKCGFKNGKELLINSAEIIVDHFRHLKIDKTIFCVASMEAIDIFRSYGLKCKTGPETGPRRYFDYLQFFEDDPEIGAVFIDQDVQINMAKAYMAATYLNRPDVHFVVGANDKFGPMTKTGTTFLPSVLTFAIMEQTKRTPTVLAKPSLDFSKLIEKKVGITDPTRVLVIGDSLDMDVGMGKKAGYQTLFVISTQDYNDLMKEEINIPDYYTYSLNEIIPSLQNLL